MLGNSYRQPAVNSGTVSSVAPEVDPSDAWTRFALAVFRANAAIVDVGNGIVEPIGQSSARWQVLGRVHEPQTVAALARAIGHARQSVQRVVDVLAGEGLVTFTDHPSDRRTKLVELTPAGADVMSRIYARQLQWSRALMPRLDEARLLRTTRALHAISETLEATTATYDAATTTAREDRSNA